jgi:hypothetical protein
MHPNDLAKAMNINPNDEDKMEDVIDTPQGFWKRNKRQVKGLLEAAKKAIPFSTKEIVEQHLNKQCLQQLINKEADRLQKLEQTRKALENNIFKLKEQEELMKANENYKKTGIINEIVKSGVTEYYEDYDREELDYYGHRSESKSNMSWFKRLGNGIKSIPIANIAKPVDFVLDGVNGAFGGSARCHYGKCNCLDSVHTTSDYGYKKVQKSRVVVEEKVVPRNVVLDLDSDKLNLYWRAQDQRAKLQSSITQEKNFIDTNEKELKVSYRIIAYLQQSINTIAMHDLDFFDRYLSIMKDNVENGKLLTENEKKEKHASIESIKKQYHLLRENQVVLTHEEKLYVNEQVETIDKEQLQAYKDSLTD